MLLVTSLFLVLSILNTSKKKSAGFVCILLSLTSYLSIPVWVHLESTSASTCSSFPFFVLSFAHIFSSLSLLFHQWEIIYQFWALFTEIPYTVPTQDLLQNSSFCLLLLYLSLCLLEHFSSLFFVLSCSLWWYVLLIHICNTS